MNKSTLLCSKILLTLLCSCLICLFGCEQEPKADKSDHSPQQEIKDKQSIVQSEGVDTVLTETKKLFLEPIKLERFETSAEALSVWRQTAKEQPTLLLLTGNPLLVRAPEVLQEKISELTSTANQQELEHASSVSNPSQIMHPSMTAETALINNWFNNLVWAIPMQDSSQNLELESFQNQFRERGMMDESEADTLTLSNGVLNGRVRSRPFKAAALPFLNDIKSPVVVHIDLSYFQSIYKNDVATPVLDLIYQTLGHLRDMQLEVQAVTFAYGHKEYQIALDVRFLGEVIATLLEKPELLDKPLPANWQRQSEALYLVNFFQEDKIDAIHNAQSQEDPNSAWVRFNLYRSAANRKDGDQALQHLAEAIAIDPVYALEYRELSKLAYERNRPDESMRMLTLAAQTYPEDASLKIRMAELADEMGDRKTALHLLEQLQGLSWSEIYHPGVSTYINNFAEELKQEVLETGMSSETTRE